MLAHSPHFPKMNEILPLTFQEMSRGCSSKWLRVSIHRQSGTLCGAPIEFWVNTTLPYPTCIRGNDGAHNHLPSRRQKRGKRQKLFSNTMHQLPRFPKVAYWESLLGLSSSRPSQSLAIYTQRTGHSHPKDFLSWWHSLPDTLGAFPNLDSLGVGGTFGQKTIFYIPPLDSVTFSGYCKESTWIAPSRHFHYFSGITHVIKEKPRHFTLTLIYTQRPGSLRRCTPALMLVQYPHLVPVWFNCITNYYWIIVGNHTDTLTTHRLGWEREHVTNGTNTAFSLVIHHNDLAIILKCY